MLLRNTKKFFQKTLNGFKSFFSSSDYQRIPKTTSPHINIQTTYKDLDTFYTDHFTNQWDSSSANKETIKPIKKRSYKKNVMKVQENNKEVHQNGSFMKFANMGKVSTGTKNVHADSRFSAATSIMRSEERSCLFAEMLKELELMDMNNVDHVLDIEDFLHYYSRLTCPAYLDIVDKFFLEIYVELFGHSATLARTASKPKLRS